MHANDYTIVRIANRQLIINTTYEFGPLTVQELSQRTCLSRPTVEALVHELLSDGILADVGLSKTGVGRSARMYAIGNSHYFAIGVDFEYPSLRICAINLAEMPVCTTIYQFTQNETPEQIIERMKLMIHDIIAQLPISTEEAPVEVIGIGVGISGLIDRDSQTSICIERISGWNDIPLPSILHDAFNLPVYMQNDVHMLSLIHQKARNRRGIHDCLYLSMRSGIGMALFFKKELIGGAQGNAGYFGHTTMDVNGPLCCCGNRGCLEIYLSPIQLVSNYYFATQKRIDYPTLLDLFEHKDPAAMETMRNAYHIFGKALSNAIKITDIQHVVINGMPTKQTDLLISWIHDGINSNTLPSISRNVVIEAEQLETTEALGAGIYMLHKFLAKPKLTLSPKS